ncbi:MAG TPA: UDP-N-acetylglucosamine--N-acetylmuramyl-(pentapeptide) pyrophosphoryl-undecaprenol N-acetylglucosamine transferase [Gemmatimonadales bacterium]|nr:UDP-N-acetylglucosamine--N-acetylmuramyl-(pentapeptide) pyrophosphoryl-undecaprenol N-acetylglucosamine transferase [Gemmatimonadales bacterium]
MGEAKSGRVLIAGGGTGGHLMPALAIAEELRRTRPDIEAVLVGAERGIEAQLLPRRDFRFHLLASEPIYRRQWWKNIRWPFLAVKLLRQVDKLLATEQPLAVLGTGGYASGPVVWLAGRRGIPTAIQEQNAWPGLATRRLSGRVRHVYLGLPEARARIAPSPSTEVFDTGNPIVPPDQDRRAAARRRFELSDERPVVLITGGSQGAVALNELVAEWLRGGGGEGMTVLWATGRGSYDRYAPLARPPSVQVFDFLDPMADGYAVANLVVARAGMMTGAELCAWGLPSLLIPLPTAAADHQTWNARALAEAGAALMLVQAGLTAAHLGETIHRLVRDPYRLGTMAAAARERGRPDASRQIVAHLLGLIGGR